MQDEPSGDRPHDPQAIIADLARRWQYPEETTMYRTTFPTDDPELVSGVSFARLVTLHLRMGGVEPDQGDLDQFLSAAWARVVESMEPAKWAREYLAALAGEKFDSEGDRVRLKPSCVRSTERG